MGNIVYIRPLSTWKRSDIKYIAHPLGTYQSLPLGRAPRKSTTKKLTSAYGQNIWKWYTSKKYIDFLYIYIAHPRMSAFDAGLRPASFASEGKSMCPLYEKHIWKWYTSKSKVYHFQYISHQHRRATYKIRNVMGNIAIFPALCIAGSLFLMLRPPPPMGKA